MADGTNGTVLSGPAVEIWIKEKFIGWGFNYTVSRQYQTVPVDEFGNLWTTQQEYVGATVSVRLSRTHMANATLEDIGIMPQGDTVAVITSEPLTFKLMDKRGNLTRHRVEGCRISGDDISVSARGLATEEITIAGCRFYTGDEA